MLCSYAIFSSLPFRLYCRYDNFSPLMADTTTLLSLPDLILVKILSYISLPELLQTVNRTCSRLHYLIETTSSLWTDVSNDFCEETTITDLRRFLRHASGFETLILPYANIGCPSYELDFLFTTCLLSL